MESVETTVWWDDDDNFDMAINHACNADLRAREKIREFFNDVQELTSLADLDTRDWLAMFPLDMRDEAIPLFEDDASATDYQLHPSFTGLDLGMAAENAHPEIFCLSTDGERISLGQPDRPQLVMGIGRLFVNTHNGGSERLSKWTGYEVFVDCELGLWIVFDRSSTSANHDGWFEFNSKLVTPQNHPLQEKQPFFDYAKICDSFSRVNSLSFEMALDSINESRGSGRVRVSQVEKKEVNDTLRKRPAPLEVIIDMDAGRASFI
ncbi:hypothetical protein O1611_g8764 [Lasiodiplodia mahajangana]|uniref:Uncharacterized protein n=1 Tax=Lasiodiplodia mahajangana TaxID=1108764 RepID=A0ACC2JBU5_9PEZI|nr:hypothetical protein O1611_g8764 [Lasiodiplodia mahajangana]